MRSQILDESYRDSPSLAKCTRYARDYWHRVWLSADHYGCFRINLAILFAEAFPDPDLYPDLTPASLGSWLEEYEQHGMLERWTVNGRDYGFWTGWFRHNTSDLRYAPKLPVPPSRMTEKGGFRLYPGESGKVRRYADRPDESRPVQVQEQVQVQAHVRSEGANGRTTSGSRAARSPDSDPKALRTDTFVEDQAFTVTAKCKAVGEKFLGHAMVDLGAPAKMRELLKTRDPETIIEVFEHFCATRKKRSSVDFRWFFESYTSYENALVKKLAEAKT